MTDQMGLKGTLAMLDSIDSSTSDEELARALQKLDPKSRAKLAERVEARLSAERRVWFCGDRTCDGQPHGAYNYAHARGSRQPDNRGSQYPPRGTGWLTWLLRAGRGAGKTRTGSEYTRYVSKKIPTLALIGPTGPAVRNVMIEGPSGLIKACESAGETFEYEPSKQRFTFQSGARAQLFSAEEPARIRGGNFGFLWGDEPAHWEDPKDVWNMAMFALRVGVRPHALATTTPIPSEFMKWLIAKSNTVSVAGSTYHNMANLAKNVVEEILAEYEGTYLGRQEIHGEMIDDRDGALWISTQFQYLDTAPIQFDRKVVAIDPAGSQGKKSDITGIVGGGKFGESICMLKDYSGKYSPSGWASQAIRMYEAINADAIVVERNYGGDMCRRTLESEGFEGRIIEAQATDGKRLRAEPIAALYEKTPSRAFHAKGEDLGKVESEMVSWIPGEGKSPNRLDAWVWAATALTRGGGKAQVSDISRQSLGSSSTLYGGRKASLAAQKMKELRR